METSKVTALQRMLLVVHLIHYFLSGCIECTQNYQGKESQEPSQQRNGWTRDIVYNNNKGETLYSSSLFIQRKSKYDSKYYCGRNFTSSTTF